MLHDAHTLGHKYWGKKLDRRIIIGLQDCLSPLAPPASPPLSGYEYLTIVDNAFPIVNLLVYNASSGKQLCKQPIFDADNRWLHIIRLYHVHTRLPSHNTNSNCVCNSAAPCYLLPVLLFVMSNAVAPRTHQSLWETALWLPARTATYTQTKACQPMPVRLYELQS